MHADDPYDGRQPTSHERHAGQPWDASYQDGPPPWDIGRPQPAVVRLAAKGGFAEPVLDAGCGSGENALHIAARGLSVLGVDVAETALATARERADQRGIKAQFEVADALQLERLGRKFSTVLDSGLFHSFDEEERRAYARSLLTVSEDGATLYVLCFSDDGPDQVPHPVSQDQLRAAFNSTGGWDIVSIERDQIDTLFKEDGSPAWLATIRRV
jgi:SAM-dependent methyltransferase